MAKYRVSVNWHVDIESGTIEEALDKAWDKWKDEGPDYSQDAVARPLMIGE